ncbi:MAG TPA: sialidase family protein [Flavitalea sp.]|nr:sialidase family protein [Flavitalea sp.]
MKPIFLFSCIILTLFSTGCKDQEPDSGFISLIAAGQMPSLATDQSQQLHLVFGNGDSIMYAVSKDHGHTFSQPALISRLPDLAASHSRGPQIAASDKGIIVTACNSLGDIFSYAIDNSGKWSAGKRVNDVDTVGKEALMALDADAENSFAVWLDLRDKHNKIFGARSVDGGKTWSKNMMIYASPDTTVCECCKPSVAIKGNKVYVMFRNWLDGNRDMYLIESLDGGNSFGEAQKLGIGSWALNGCPMDGGGLAINEKSGNPQTVWRREGSIYECEPGTPEKEIGVGRGCTMESIAGKNYYAWTEDGEVVCVLPDGEKRSLGKGGFPVIKAVASNRLICVWENDKQIHHATVSL